jgi:uncharacterized protein YqgV (UPF0045/DUF77 family)
MLSTPPISQLTRLVLSYKNKHGKMVFLKRSRYSVGMTDSYGKRPYDLTPYRNAVTRAAEAEYEREFVAFPKRRDRRQRDRVTGKKVGGYDQSILHKKASDVDGDWLGTNVMRDTQEEFMKKMPQLWKLFCRLANRTNPDVHHISTLALNMLFKARNKNLRAVQTVIGVYLHANGVPTQVITLLSQYGISVGLDSLKTIMESLAKDQVERLKALGRQIADEQLVIVYDNINVHEKVNQLRVDNRNHQFNGITGFVARAIGGRPVPARDSIHAETELTEDDSDEASLKE